MHQAITTFGRGFSAPLRMPPVWSGSRQLILWYERAYPSIESAETRPIVAMDNIPTGQALEYIDLVFVIILQSTQVLRKWTVTGVTEHFRLYVVFFSQVSFFAGSLKGQLQSSWEKRITYISSYGICQGDSVSTTKVRESVGSQVAAIVVMESSGFTQFRRSTWENVPEEC